MSSGRQPWSLYIGDFSTWFRTLSAPIALIPEASTPPESSLASLRTMPAALLGGHPYLARLAMYSAATRGLRLEQVTSDARPGAQVFDGFLETCRRRLMSEPGLWPTAERALAGRPLSGIDRLLIPRLLRLGLVRPDGDAYPPRYPLFQRLLGL